jgi:hypothetical protein
MKNLHWREHQRGPHRSMKVVLFRVTDAVEGGGK